MSGLLIVGEASRGPSKPFTGRTGARIAEALGTPFLAREADLVNLLPSWPGRNGAKGDAFPVEPARAAAEMLLAVSPHPVVVLCGRRVAGAFGLGKADWLSWTVKGGRFLGLLPHPSGVVLWWNDPENRAAAAAFMAEARRLSLLSSRAWTA